MDFQPTSDTKEKLTANLRTVEKEEWLNECLNHPNKTTEHFEIVKTGEHVMKFFRGSKLLALSMYLGSESTYYLPIPEDEA